MHKIGKALQKSKLRWISTHAKKRITSAFVITSKICYTNVVDALKNLATLQGTSLVQVLTRFKEILLSNLIMLSEIPAPTGNTTARGSAIADRLGEYDVLDVSVDAAGNIIAKCAPEDTAKSRNTIALLAHMDTHYRNTDDHAVHVHTNSLTGVGLTDNSLGIATLLTLPYIMQDIGLILDSDIIFCFAADSLGQGDLTGTRFFLDNITQPIQYGICIEGYPLGRMSYSSIGMLRYEITHKVPAEFDWSRFGTTNAIVNTNHIINRILEIPLPNRPKTSIIFNKLRSGASFNITPTQATLLFEVRSQSNEIVHEVHHQIQGIVSESTSDFGAAVTLREIARRSSGGLSYNHPLVRKHSEILTNLSISPRITPSVSDLSAFIDKAIPAVGLGLTNCERYNQPDELMYIEPCFTGIAQVLMLLSAISQGEIQ